MNLIFDLDDTLYDLMGPLNWFIKSYMQIKPMRIVRNCL